MRTQGYVERIADKIGPALAELWTQAWAAGATSAQQITAGGKIPPPTVLQGVLRHLARTWVAQIVSTTIKLLAAILAAAAGLTVAVLVARLLKVLADLERAAKIAITEITRLMAMAALSVYQHAGHTRVRWVTEHDSRVCPACAANEAAGDWPLGVPFPSGAPWPPQHPGCRCALVPGKPGVHIVPQQADVA